MRCSGTSSSSRVEIGALTAILLTAGLFGALMGVPAQAQPAAPFLPAYSSGVTDSFTLYGNAGLGWGFNATTITTPGPNLTVNYGDNVELSLISEDGAKHDWFIDLNGNKQPDPGEPTSPDFQGSIPIAWNFTADIRPGTYTYYCRYHFATMFGNITIAVPTHYTLYGNAEKGWGFSPNNISAPGPNLLLAVGVNVTFTLHSEDGAPHTWGIDTNADGLIGTGEPDSPQFQTQTLNWTYAPTFSGNYTYRCRIHPTTMYGSVMIIGAGGQGPPPTPIIGLVPGIMVATIIIVLILAAVYQIRSVRANRREKG